MRIPSHFSISYSISNAKKERTLSRKHPEKAQEKSVTWVCIEHKGGLRGARADGEFRERLRRERSSIGKEERSSLATGGALLILSSFLTQFHLA